MSTVLVVQHLPHEHEGVLGEALVRADVDIRRWRAWADAAPPTMAGADALVVLGGDMNTDEEQRWPHLATVRDLLGRAVEQQVPTLAICLGAQLLAEAAGGRVTHGVPEIGWIPIQRTADGHDDPVVSAVPDRTPFFNAHADYITLPPTARLLARSERAPVHAFSLGVVRGIQFHPEIDASYVAGYVGADGVEDYLLANGWAPEELVRQARIRNDAHRATGAALFEAWIATLG